MRDPQMHFIDGLSNLIKEVESEMTANEIMTYLAHELMFTAFKADQNPIEGAILAMNRARNL